MHPSAAVARVEQSSWESALTLREDSPYFTFTRACNTPTLGAPTLGAPTLGAPTLGAPT